MEPHPAAQSAAAAGEPPPAGPAAATSGALPSGLHLIRCGQPIDDQPSDDDDVPSRPNPHDPAAPTSPAQVSSASPCATAPELRDFAVNAANGSSASLDGPLPSTLPTHINPTTASNLDGSDEDEEEVEEEEVVLLSLIHI